MPFMQWSEVYSVGVARIDGQHKNLIKMINDLHAALAAGGDRESLDQVLQDLMRYTDFHFTSEEKLLAQAGYAGLAAHQQKHRAMRAEVERIVAAAATAQTSASIKLMHFLKEWLAHHICETDKAYAPTLQAARIE